MNIAICLVHNKSNKANKAQLDALIPLIEKHTESHDEEVQDRTVTEVEEKYLDEFGAEQTRMVTQEVLGEPYTATFETYYYTLKGLPDYEVKFFQIIPFGVTPPPNIDAIDSHKVWYGEGDSDKQGDHPRFFNWALKRGTDLGAEVVLYMEDIKKLSIDDLATELNTLVDPNVKTEFIENQSAKLSTVKLLHDEGQLREDKSLSEELVDYKEKISEKVIEMEVKKNG